MTDFLANSFLFFGHQEFIITLLIIGYIWLDQRTFYHALCLIGISIILNVALKVTFKVPLTAFLKKEGFAFPSGHMQASTTLYGWLVWRYSSIYIRCILIVLLIGIGMSLVHFGYHNYKDVFGGAIAAILLIGIYSRILKYKPHILSWYALIFVTCLIFYINEVYYLKPHVWRSYYILWGLILITQKVSKGFSFNSFSQKILGTFIIVGTLELTRFLLFNSSSNQFSIYMSQLKWLVVGSIFPLSKRITYWVDFFYKNKIKTFKEN